MPYKKNKKTLYYFLIVLCLLGMCVMAFFYWSEMQPRIEAEDTYEEIRTWAFSNEPEESMEQAVIDDEGKQENGLWSTPDFKALKAWNSDIIAWIYSPGTTIDYPVVQAKDNDFYLNHTIDRKRSVIGSIFMESQNSSDFSDDISVLYGHHIKQGRMFSALSGYKSQDYYDQHPNMVLYTEEAIYDIELFAGNVISGNIGSFPLNFSTIDEKEEWINQCLQNSTFHSKIKPNIDDRLIVLCTCTYEYQDARYIVYGRLKQRSDEVSHDKK